ncbi:MAG TPA: HU family DNA-binding protein [Longimicrobium sp.]|jgi:nucleoid DNA-binding protein
MTRSEFLDEVAHKADLPREAVERVVNAIFDAADGAIAQAMRSDGSLSIRGFGRFTRHALPGRNGGNGGGSERAAITFEPSRRLSGSNGKRRAPRVDEDEITPDEAAFRRRLVEGLRRIQGMEIENLFPGGWADEQVRP